MKTCIGVFVVVSTCVDTMSAWSRYHDGTESDLDGLARRVTMVNEKAVAIINLVGFECGAPW